MNKRDIIVLTLIVVALAGILALLPFRMAPRPAPRAANTVTNIEESTFPDSFPANLPIQGAVRILRNYTAVSPDGRVQATRSFTSAKSVDENFAFYKTFLGWKQTGWTLVNEVNDPATPTHKALFARNADGVATINISAGTASGTSILDVSFRTIQAK